MFHMPSLLWQAGERETEATARARTLAEQLEVRDLEVARLREELKVAGGEQRQAGQVARATWDAIEKVQAQVESAAQ
eukprot:8899900-Pyramimonas_sp.AAC.1